MKIPAVPLIAACCLSACGGDDSPSQVRAPGGKAQADTAVLEAGAAALQDRPPVEALNAYLDGFHFYNGTPEGQMEAHHYCAILNEDLIQCVIYDGNVGQAKLMGVEYIVSEKLFKTLPAAERTFWHSHVHEVKSGQLIAPGIPKLAEHRLMEKLVSTYGKTWHTWHTDRKKSLPTGVPQLMMGFTADGQARADMVAARDRRMQVSSEQNRQERQDIPVPQIVEGADHWQRQAPVQLGDPTGAPHEHTP
ncbi:OBAP family protein [Pseudoxanthomonas composti]|uniref:DUF1264 domain-containing protein n=1 Tax=Pseudoxanthomonas composti TaxID=2137479 RepID=A0A4Q1JRI4_9GAMM|nr:OBAP family protein [Pseudoxanthomonas composti]RXR00844.1 DUF1264 domain-containing protein [Pseudoxanthomonas composti]